MRDLKLRKYGFHWLKKNKRSWHGVEGPWKIGEIRTIDIAFDEFIECCVRGYHAGPTLLEAWEALGEDELTMACLVLTSRAEDTDDEPYKWVAKRRQLVFATNIHNLNQLYDSEAKVNKMFLKRLAKKVGVESPHYKAASKLLGVK